MTYLVVSVTDRMLVDDLCGPASWAGPDGRHDAAPHELDGRRPGPLSPAVTALWLLVLGFALSVWGAAGWSVAALVADGAAAGDRWRAAAACGGVAAACLAGAVALAAVPPTRRRSRRDRVGR